MAENTPRLALQEILASQAQKHVTMNNDLIQIDAVIDMFILGLFVNTPPGSPSDGDTYITGGSPTGAWSGFAYKIAYCIDDAWRFFMPFNGARAFNNADGKFYVYVSGAWIDWNSMLSAAETSVASAATCDLGAAGSLFVQITGTTAIMSFGSGVNKLRFVRFAQALTLTHNATSLILLGGASRTTAAGDIGIYASDASGNWRERDYSKANGSILNAQQVAKDIGAARNALTSFSNISVSGLSSATEVMGGFGSTLKLTPAFSGRVRVKLFGYVSSDTVSANTNFRGRYGTGTAPSALAAVTGMSTSNFIQARNAVSNQAIPFAYEVEISGLTVSTQYWFDLSIATTLSGTSAVTIVSAIVEEF